MYIFTPPNSTHKLRSYLKLFGKFDIRNAIATCYSKIWIFYLSQLWTLSAYWRTPYFRVCQMRKATIKNRWNLLHVSDWYMDIYDIKVVKKIDIKSGVNDILYIYIYFQQILFYWGYFIKFNPVGAFADT